MAKILVCDQTKCSGCRSCQVWCSFHHAGECNPSLARLMVIAFEEKSSFVPVICHQCRDPWCMKACPADAMTRDPETNAVLILADHCTGCRACADACPFGVIRINPEGDMLKCDLCSGDPVCVKSCIPRALTFVEPAEAYLDRAASVASKTEGAV
ncbi:MAG: 4Fe-4S dicluster domain-containing protein [Chloroflexi bacterium]|nr:4Fe-4S dicluster domain-containing protein [Chloroflexota bacterium]